MNKKHENNADYLQSTSISFSLKSIKTKTWIMQRYSHDANTEQVLLSLDIGQYQSGIEIRFRRIFDIVTCFILYPTLLYLQKGYFVKVNALLSKFIDKKEAASTENGKAHKNGTSNGKSPAKNGKDKDQSKAVKKNQSEEEKKDQSKPNKKDQSKVKEECQSTHDEASSQSEEDMDADTPGCSSSNESSKKKKKGRPRKVKGDEEESKKGKRKVKEEEEEKENDEAGSPPPSSSKGGSKRKRSPKSDPKQPSIMSMFSKM